MILTNKWLAAAVSCVALSLTACGGSNSGNQTAAPAPASDTNSASTASAPASGKVLRVAMNAEFGARLNRWTRNKISKALMWI